jgi:hypothetical protein
MRKIAILLAASTALVFGAAPAWQAYAQMERGPAALASAPKNFTPIVKAACGPYWGALHAQQGAHQQRYRPQTQ